MDKDQELEIFARPLVLGASISAGYGNRDGGIGTVLARKINPDAQVVNKAVSGATSVQGTVSLDLNAFTPSIVLGFDLFFWDAMRFQTGPKFEENTRRLFKYFQRRRIPMIIGRVPVLDLPFGAMTGIKESIGRVNSLLEQCCTLKHHSLLYDPKDCFMSMDGGKHFNDFLHLSSEGNSYSADFYIQSAAHKNFLDSFTFASSNAPILL